MRGNRNRAHRDPIGGGSIPAHAGKPECLVLIAPGFRVYPRPCGETFTNFLFGSRCGGLSPPMRGNPLHLAKPAVLARSIPAHAGKPDHSDETSVTIQVYPRPCGETSRMLCWFYWYSGLSPPMRGNLHDWMNQTSYQGSIPAHAGKPNGRIVFNFIRRVYPRPCGETSSLQLAEI